MAWTPFTVAGAAGEALPDDVVTYGPDIPTEATFKLLGDVTGKRIVDLGCGAGRNTVALARAGARAIGVEPDGDELGKARSAAEAAEVKAELHQSSLAELAFLRADTIDAVISVGSLAGVDDIGRVFRQIHRVLHPNQPFVIALPHPAFSMVDPTSPDAMRIRRSYFDPTPYPAHDARGGQYPRTFQELFTDLHRASFSVDQVLEPEPAAESVRSPHWSPAMTHVPATLIVRARKEGI